MDRPGNENGSEALVWMLVFAVLVAGLGAVAVLLVRENGRLRERLEVAAAERRLAAGLDLGRQLAPLRLEDASGRSVDVRFEGEAVGTLVLVHAAGCDACAATIGAWREVVAAADRPDVRVVCVQTDAAESGVLALEGLPASLAVPLPPTGWLSSLPAVPATLLVDDRGALLWAAFDELDEADVQSLADALASVGMSASSAGAAVSGR